MSKRWSVTLPITGYVAIDVVTDDDGTEEDAIELALSGDITDDDIIEWEAIRQVNRGNVCYCMHPWEAEASLFDQD